MVLASDLLSEELISFKRHSYRPKLSISSTDYLSARNKVVDKTQAMGVFKKLSSRSEDVDD